MIDIVDIVKNEIYAKLNRSLFISAFVPFVSENRIRVVFCDFKWIKTGMTLTDRDGNDFVVKNIGVESGVKYAEIEFDDEAEPPFEFVIGFEFLLPLPFFIDGTQMTVNSELGIKAQYDLTAVTPLFWLHENINELVYPEYSPFERQSDIEIFLLDEIIYHEGNDDNRNRGVKPMLSLASEVVKAVDKNKATFNREVNADMRTISRFGKETEKGIESYILDADLGGVRLKLTIDVSEKPCKC
jgi:hypothetical protein